MNNVYCGDQSKMTKGKRMNEIVTEQEKEVDSSRSFVGGELGW